MFVDNTQASCVTFEIIAQQKWREPSTDSLQVNNGYPGASCSLFLTVCTKAAFTIARDIYCSESLNHSATLRFTYELGGSSPRYEEPQSHRIVKEIPDITVTENQTVATVAVTGLHAGAIIVGVNSSDDQFVE